MVARLVTGGAPGVAALERGDVDVEPAVFIGLEDGLESLMSSCLAMVDSLYGMRTNPEAIVSDSVALIQLDKRNLDIPRQQG